MTKKKPPGPRGPAHVLPQRAAASLIEFWRAIVRSAMKSKAHRTPTQAKVNAALSALEPRLVVLPLKHVLRRFERRIGKPSRLWTAGERREVSSLVHRTFDEMRMAVENPRGRPRARRGIIRDEMRKGEDQQRKQSSQAIRDLKRKLPGYIRAYKLGVYARNELWVKESEARADPRGALAKVGRYVANEPWIEQEVKQAASTAEAIRDLLKAADMDRKLEQALRQHMSRLRKK